MLDGVETGRGEGASVHVVDCCCAIVEIGIVDEEVISNSACFIFVAVVNVLVVLETTVVETAVVF